MAAERRQNQNVSLKPMSEEECAALAGYTYLRHNIRSPEVVQAQEKSIRRIVKLINRQAPQCSCLPIGNKKCTTDGCPNRRDQISCPPTCGPQCQNSPWEHKSFVAGKKTCLKMTEYGWGVFSTAFISKGTFVGEYTGKVALDTTELPAIHENYFFNIPPKGYVIQAFEQSTCMRCVNHSCEPNLDYHLYIDNAEYKIVYYAVDDILPNTELLVDYRWVWKTAEEAMPCKCGTPKCKGIIGTIEPKPKPTKRRDAKRVKEVTRKSCVTSSDNEVSTSRPPTFPSSTLGSTAEVTEVLTTTPRPQERPDTYVENHVFRVAEPAYIITQYNGRLGIVQGRITECYTNDHNITIYVVDVRSPATMQYHMPRYLCYHYPEDAAYVLQHHIPEEERSLILDYATPYASRGVAEGLEYNMPASYAEMVIDSTLPRNRLERRNFSGPVALGLPTSRLVQCDSEDDIDDEADEDCQEKSTPPVDFRPSRSSHMTAEQLDSYIVNQICSSSRLPSTSSGTLPQRCPRATPALVVIPDSSYNPHSRRNFPKTRDEFHNLSLVRRNFESATENVTWFTISRTRTEVQVDYNHLYRNVASVLEYYYMEAPPILRRYLTLSHFNAANEANLSGSTLKFYCSFCKEKFNDDEPLRHHFHMYHTIVAIYKCPMCDKQFSLPSMFRLHVFTCDPILGLSFILNITLPMVDAFADYAASRTSNNAPKFVLQPGLPNFTRQPGNFRVQSSYKNVLMDWPTHNYVDEQEPRPSGRPPRPEPARSNPKSRQQRQQYTNLDSNPSEDDDLPNGQESRPEMRAGQRSRITSRNRGQEHITEHCVDQNMIVGLLEQQPGPSNRPHMPQSAKSKKRSRPQRHYENQDSCEDAIGNEDAERFETLRPGESNISERPHPQTSRDKSGEKQRVGKQTRKAGACSKKSQIMENECRERRQPSTSKGSRECVQLQTTGRKGRMMENEDRFNFAQQSERMTRAATAKKAGTFKIVKNCEPEFSWIDPSSDESDDDVNDSVYQPEKRKRRH